MKKTKVFMIFVLTIGITVLVFPTDFGGYYGTDWGNTKPPVQAFLDTVDGYSGHTTTGPNLHYKSTWDTANNNGVDNYMFTYTCEHGSPWSIATNDGTCNFNSYGFGGSSHQGWGDDRCNWIVLYSCQVICSPIEASDWWSPWKSDNPNDVTDGVHMIMGFRTNAYVYPAVSVSTHFADDICTGDKILYHWFYSVWNYSYCQTSSNDKACAVFSPGSKDDKLTSYSSDPNPGTFWCWYY